MSDPTERAIMWYARTRRVRMHGHDVYVIVLSAEYLVSLVRDEERTFFFRLKSRKLVYQIQPEILQFY